ncbi:MAG TPA: histidine kinase N-terminal 7TM domain-containing protein [Cyclobacteriaceae bacterium]|nr:histidine kinase N-terminal 7TM domain-containing protein [Cyclobacteriaceae bacterium]
MVINALMQVDLNVYAIILLISGTVAGAFSFYIFYRLGGKVKWFAVTLLNVSVWVFFYGLELTSISLSSMYFWIKVEYLGIVFTSVTWLLFSLKYTDKDKLLNHKWFIVALLLIPALTYLLVLTNEWHHLYYRSLHLSNEGPFPLLAIQKGPWYYIHSCYFYLSILTGNYILFANSRRADLAYKNQTYLLLASTSIPLIVNVLYLIGFRIQGHIDPTPFAFIGSFLFTGLGLAKYNLLAVVPIAKEQLIAVMSDGLMVVNERNKVIEMNPSMKKILGGHQENYIGSSVEKILVHHHAVVDVLQEQIPKEARVHLHDNDSVYFVEIIPLLGRNNSHKGSLILFKDITEERRNQTLLKNQADQLNKHNRLKDKLFSIISHDLKGPVSGVKEIIDLTKNGYIDAEEFKEILPALSESIDGVSLLLTNLLAWSRNQLKGDFMDKVVFDVYKLAQQQIILMKPIAALKRVDLQMDFHGSTMVFADKNTVELVIRNLINNAIKFCESGDSITVGIHDYKEEVKIIVKDTGVGISHANLARLRKGDAFSTFGSNNESGTGLGLLLVRDYVEKNGGNLWIDSKENEWSEFSFDLPKINVN